jgi:hypothetical protein
MARILEKTIRGSIGVENQVSMGVHSLKDICVWSLIRSGKESLGETLLPLELQVSNINDHQPLN